MKKALFIGWKDLLQRFRDPGALALMLVTPFALTLVMGFAFGAFGGDDGGGLTDIPVALVNLDGGMLGEALVEVFQGEALADLMAPQLLDDPAAARELVDGDQVAAAVIVPEGFTDGIIPVGLFEGEAEFDQAMIDALINAEPGVIEVYANPGSPVSVAVVRTVVERFIGTLTASMTAGQVSIGQMVIDGLVTADEMETLGPEIGKRLGQQEGEMASLVNVVSETADGSREVGFDYMGYMAPSLSILFLMFTVTAGGRSVLSERRHGTLPRMLTTPTQAAQVIGGKVLGIFAGGLAQMVILVAATSLLLGVDWGPTLAVALLVVSVVAAATTWGMLIAAFSRTPGQAGAMGTAISLIFGVSSGGFFPRGGLPQWLQTASLISPNGWALEGFSQLAAQGGLSDVWGSLLGLWAMAAILFLVSVFAFRRQYA